jgi:ribosomal protein S27E
MPAAACAQRSRAPPFIEPSGYARHRPESTPLYQLVEQNYPEFRELRAREGRSLPDYVQEEFDAYLKCGRLEEGFLRVRCDGCHAEKLVAFSCKKRGFCPSCGGRRMAETAALLADEVLPERPLRQWVLSLPFALRLLVDFGQGYLFGKPEPLDATVATLVERETAGGSIYSTG